MTSIQFGRLTDMPLREAWKHEATEFTPWLAENIDHLSEAIGIPLELTGTEVAVESFSADILARNPMDDSVVLIENQLETTDHTHLGQIMTYLAGLEAQTVVWIAPAFREPHLSAIRWLNEHTADGFSFFAVKARVVRIGDSPYAPIFDVAEKPDEWGRKIKGETPKNDLKAPRSKYFDRIESLCSHMEFRRRNRRLVAPLSANSGVGIVLEMNRDRAMVFVASDTASDFGDLTEEIQALTPDVEAKLGDIREAKWGGALFKSKGCDLTNEQSWDATLAWHKDWLEAYFSALAPQNGGA